MKRLILSTLFICGIALLGVRSASAVSIDFSPNPATVNNGDSLSVDIVVSGLGAAPADIVSAFDVLVSFDSAVLSPTGYSFTTNLGDPLLVEAFTNDDVFVDPFATAGLADLFEVSLLTDADLLALQSALPTYPSFTLATIDFTAIADGSPNLAFNWDLLYGYDVKGSRNVPIIPTTVPEPSTVLLMAVGIAGLGFGRRKLRA